MEDRFDSLARAVSSAVSRRQALWRLAGFAAFGVLGSFGLASGEPTSCGHCCELQCRSLDPPPRGEEMGVCMQSCIDTGIAIGPTGNTSATCLEVQECP